MWAATLKLCSLKTKRQTGKALKIVLGGGRGVLGMLKYKFSCEEPWITQALVVIPTLYCTVKQLIKIGWWHIKSVIQINSKPFLTELQKNPILAHFQIFFFSLLFHSPFLPFHCSLGLSLLSHSCFLSPSRSIIAKSIWNCHWEQLSRNGFVHILKTVSVIKNTKVQHKELVKYPCVWPLVARRCPLLGQLLTWNNISAVQPLYCSFVLAMCVPQKINSLSLYLSGTAICVTQTITRLDHTGRELAWPACTNVLLSQ